MDKKQKDRKEEFQAAQRRELIQKENDEHRTVSESVYEAIEQSKNRDGMLYIKMMVSLPGSFAESLPQAYFTLLLQ